MIPSRSQVDQLGDRLRASDPTEDDLRLLDLYRLSFTPAYEQVVQLIRDALSVDPSGRPGKSTLSIIAKLRRQSVRLSQMEDISGCRIVVYGGIEKQNQVVRELQELFVGCRVFDRRQKASHGYRAVHVVVTVDGMPVEIQVRTPPQHLWAEVSEKIADTFDPAIKYGGGPPAAQKALMAVSKLVEEVELKKGVDVGSQMEEIRARLKDVSLQ